MIKKIYLILIFVITIFNCSASAYTLLDYEPDPYSPPQPWHYDGPNDIKWEIGSTVIYKFHDSISAEQGDLIHDAFSTWWNTGINLSFEFNNTAVTSYDSPDPEYSMFETLINPPSFVNGTTFYRVNEPSAFYYGAIGLTSTQESSEGFTLDAPIYLNSLNFSPSDASNLFYNVVLHEIGHLLGLGHSNITDAIMRPSAYTDSRAELFQDDIDGVLYLYGSRQIPVPEPATILIFSIGLLGLAGVNKKKQ